MEKETSNSGNKLKPILIVVVILLVLTIGTLLGIGFSTGKIQEVTATMFDSSEEITVPLDQFLVNLTPGESNRDQYLQIELSIFSSQKDAEATITEKTAQIRDAVITVLRNKTSDSLYATTEDGTLVIKNEIKEKINQEIGTGLVNEVYITNVVTQ
ncbi:flagellar basal body-associated FliL family protein [Desemzia sp. RIT804]|uniref:flagellar basal body-associated FliL family protein n=1 Tax=Desemzia sp. RIT 804 TaxID=2810209 RepID=UPI001951AB65|nr:flagellar basal body-associated FliL family protein [Desemzia sp. RIT 804]MBM6614688.1 flagellar basal body-associated FliL family protein [Desemzia sp. RIT 804]